VSDPLAEAEVAVRARGLSRSAPGVRLTRMRLGVTEHIDCAHFLPGHPKCGQLHGHTYKIEVVVEGQPEGGMLVDFAELRAQIRVALKPLDHRNLNDVLEYPSVENICQLLSARLKEQLRFPFVVRVYEGQGKWAEV
jgi:6-pyruvoyltetrahydropterin/6-carboxytetrahydropterin synthase